MKLVKPESQTEKKKEPVAKKKLNQSTGTPLNIKAILLGTIGIILTIVICVVIAFEQLYEPPLLTINGEKYNLTDMKYCIFEHELQGFQQENMYQSYFRTSFLDQVVDEETGETNIDQLKTQTMEDFIQEELLYKEAMKKDYSVSDEDKKTAEDTISSIKEQMDSSILRENNFSTSYLKKAIQKQQVASRFRQDTIDGFDIDDEAIKAGIKYEDHHQYELGVFTVKKTKEVTNENAENTENAEGTDNTENTETTTEPLSKEELKAAYDSLAALKDQVASSDDLSSILAEDEKTITYASNTIKKDSTDYGKKNIKKILKMDNGQVSDILETDDAYYLIKMVNNKATTEYDSEVSSAISAEETTQFNDYMEKLKGEYTIKQSKNEWEDLNFGYITINAYGNY